MHTDIPAYLPLSDGLRAVLTALREGDETSWMSKALITRAVNHKLVKRVPAVGAMLTEQGRIVADVALEHGYSTSYAHPGRIGVKGRCRCGGWVWSTNEKGHAGHALVRNAFARHLATEIAKREAGA